MNLTNAELQTILQRPNIAKANPDLGGLGGSVHPKQAPALERDAPIKQSRQSSVACRVEIIGLRRKLLDDDNFCAGAKPLRDAIASSLGIDDGEASIQFHYAQVISDRPGTIVRINWL